MSNEQADTAFEMVRQAAEERLLQAKDRDPRVFPHGMFVQGMTDDDNPGLFVWYATTEERRQAVIDDVSAAWAEDEAGMREAKEGALSALETGGFCDDGTLDQVSDEIIDACVIWAGTFDELCSGNHPFAEVARGSFREPDHQAEEPEGAEKSVLIDEPAAEGEHSHDGDDCCDHDPIDPALAGPITPAERDLFAEFLPNCG